MHLWLPFSRSNQLDAALLEYRPRNSFPVISNSLSYLSCMPTTLLPFSPFFLPYIIPPMAFRSVTLKDILLYLLVDSTFHCIHSSSNQFPASPQIDPAERQHWTHSFASGTCGNFTTNHRQQHCGRCGSRKNTQRAPLLFFPSQSHTSSSCHHKIITLVTQFNLPVSEVVRWIDGWMEQEKKKRKNQPLWSIHVCCCQW